MLVGGGCSEQCEVLGGRRRCWGAAADMCQTCQFSHALFVFHSHKFINVQHFAIFRNLRLSLVCCIMIFINF